MDRQSAARSIGHGLGYAAIAVGVFGAAFVVAVWFA